MVNVPCHHQADHTTCYVGIETNPASSILLYKYIKQHKRSLYQKVIGAFQELALGELFENGQIMANQSVHIELFKNGLHSN